MKKNKINKNQLEEKVRSLFRRAGFDISDEEEVIILQGGQKHRTVEIGAKLGEDSLKILIECKEGRQSNLQITNLVNDYLEIQKQSKADKIIFVIPDREIEEKDRNYINEKKMILWDLNKLKYYEILTDTIKHYARYEIIHAIGLETKEESNVHHVLALKITQPLLSSTQEIFLFSATPDILLKTAVVFRRAAEENKKAFQRLLRKPRLSEIARYVSKTDALLPTDIVIALPNKIEVSNINLSDQQVHISSKYRAQLVVLRIPLKYASLEIIDGQHRLFGFIDADNKYRKGFSLVITGLKSIPEDKKKQIFIDINEKAKKLDPNLLAHLSYTDNENLCKENPRLMAIKVVMELNKITPFKGKIRYLETGDEIITLKGFSGYDLRSLVSPKGALRQFNKSNSSEKYIKSLRKYFSIISKLFKEEWNNPEEYIIATNRGITAFLKLLNSLVTITKPKRELSQLKIEKYLKQLKKFPSWETKHLKGQYIGAAGWKKFYEDLQKTIRKKYKNFGKA